MSVQPRAPRSQRCSRMTTRPPQRVGTCVRAVRPSAPRITTASDTMLWLARPDAPSHWLNAARTSCCAVAKFCARFTTRRGIGLKSFATGAEGGADDEDAGAGVDDETDGGAIGDETEGGSDEIGREVGVSRAAVTAVEVATVTCSPLVGSTTACAAAAVGSVTSVGVVTLGDADGVSASAGASDPREAEVSDGADVDDGGIAATRSVGAAMLPVPDSARWRITAMKPRSRI